MRSGNRELSFAGVALGAGCALSLIVCEPFVSAQGMSSSSSTFNGPDQSSANINSVRRPTDPPPFDPTTPPAIDPSKVKLSARPVEEDKPADMSATSSEAGPASPKAGPVEPKATPVEPKAPPVEPKATSVEARTPPVRVAPSIRVASPVANAPAPLDPAPPEWSAAPAARMAEQPAAGAVVGVDSLGRRVSGEMPSARPAPASRRTVPGSATNDVMPLPSSQGR
jgi:hypothetical protein